MTPRPTVHPVRAATFGDGQWRPGSSRLWRAGKRQRAPTPGLTWYSPLAPPLRRGPVPRTYPGRLSRRRRGRMVPAHAAPLKLGGLDADTGTRPPVHGHRAGPRDARIPQQVGPGVDRAGRFALTARAASDLLRQLR